MKAYKTIKKELATIAEKIKAAEAEIDRLSMIDERHAAADKGDYNTVKSLRDQARENDEKIFALSQEIHTNKIKAAILEDNSKAAFAAEALPIILKALAPYEGKKYGERTKEKIWEEVHAANIGFYFEGYSDYTTIVCYEMRGNCKYWDCIEARINAKHATPFIDKENRITAATAETYTSYKYTENPGKRAREIQKAFTKLEKAHAAARAAQAEYNNLIPQKMKSQNAIDYSVRMF